MATTPLPKWIFTTRLRSRAFGWSGSPLACQRIKEAVSELQKAARQDPLRAAEGAILLIQRLWPALQEVDSSTGALGSATNHAVDAAIDLIIAAPADTKTRAKWLERLWEAFNDDGVGYVYGLARRWGELCVSPEVAGQWADRLLPIIRRLAEEHAQGGPYTYFNGEEPCLSCLLAANRHQELLDLVDLKTYKMWSDRRYGVRALVAMGRPDEAITYALASQGLNDNPMAIARTCEEILLTLGRDEEAYQRFALTANCATTNLATYRALKKKYPSRNPAALLQDLIAHSPGEEGKWFATAKDLGLFDVALELVRDSPADPKTLNRAARDYMVKNPHFALGAALASLRWIVAGYGYEVTAADISEACRYALHIAEERGVLDTVLKEIRQIVHADTPWAKIARQALGMPQA